MLIRNKKSMSCSYLLISKVSEDFYPQKSEGFRLSRRALKDLTDLENLNIVNHLYMEDQESTKVSISHTKGLGCAMISKDSKLQSIGIDIEWSDRKYKPAIEKYFMRDEDQESLSLIQVWACKEAAYKALFPLYKGQKPLVLKDFVIRDERIFFEGRDIGEVKVEELFFEKRALTLAQATISFSDY